MLKKSVSTMVLLLKHRFGFKIMQYTHGFMTSYRLLPQNYIFEYEI